MNLQKVAVVGLDVMGNGVDTVFTLDLIKDTYFILSSTGFGSIQNWFSNTPKPPGAFSPTGVSNPGSPNSVSLSGTVVTYTFITAPIGQTQVEFALLF